MTPNQALFFDPINQTQTLDANVTLDFFGKDIYKITLDHQNTCVILSPANFTQMSGPDPKCLHMSQTGFRT